MFVLVKLPHETRPDTLFASNPENAVAVRMQGIDRLRCNVRVGMLVDAAVDGRPESHCQLMIRAGFSGPDRMRRIRRFRQKLVEEGKLPPISGLAFTPLAVEALFQDSTTRFSTLVLTRAAARAPVSKDFSFHIGADPEFGLIDADLQELVYAEEVLPNSRAAAFGADGPGAELRPQAAIRPEDVVHSLHTALNNPPGRSSAYEWIGGATYTDENRTYWFGGHLHFEVPPALRPTSSRQLAPIAKEYLNIGLALPLLPADFPEPWKRRDGCSSPQRYGHAQDLRYANDQRWEYRVLSGLWCVHPALATLVFRLGKRLVSTAYSDLSKEGVNFKSLLERLAIKSKPEQVDQALSPIHRVINAARGEGYTKAERELSFRLWESIGELTAEEEACLEALARLSSVGPANCKRFSLDLHQNWCKEHPLLEPGKSRNDQELHAALEKIDHKEKKESTHE